MNLKVIVIAFASLSFALRAWALDPYVRLNPYAYTSDTMAIGLPLGLEAGLATQMSDVSVMAGGGFHFSCSYALYRSEMSKDLPAARICKTIVLQSEFFPFSPRMNGVFLAGEHALAWGNQEIEIRNAEGSITQIKKSPFHSFEGSIFGGYQLYDKGSAFVSAALGHTWAKISYRKNMATSPAFRFTLGLFF